MDDIKVPKIDPNRCGPDIRQGVNNRISGSGTALCNTNILQDRMYFEVKVINPDGASSARRLLPRRPPAPPAACSPIAEAWYAAAPAGKFCIGLSGPDTNLAELMSGNNGNNKKERAQTKWTFIFESDQVPERFKAGDVIVSQPAASRCLLQIWSVPPRSLPPPLPLLSAFLPRLTQRRAPLPLLLQSVSYDQSDYPTILNFHQNGHEAPFKSITSVRGDMRPAVSGEMAG
jgi:hypothetical protein